jgi:SAM-dependent methyltransferase
VIIGPRNHARYLRRFAGKLFVIIEMHCRICGNDRDNIRHEFAEMMFRTNERFEYLECGSCGTIQIGEIPDLAAYYPNNYISFGVSGSGISRRWARKLATRSAAKYLINGRSLVGKLITTLRPSLEEIFPDSMRYRGLDLTFGSRILDVGCGAGQLLLTLSNFGFKRLIGADPFIDHDIEYANGVLVKKSEIHGIEGKFDLIMFHHSLEHIADPIAALQSAHRLLENGNYCLVRIPVISFAWRKYGRNWVQLDAPRHLSLFTRDGFIMAAEKAGFRVERVVDDSTSFQFWGSEQISRGVPVIDGMRGGDEYLRNAFGSSMKEWEQMAEELNSKGRGDQACFYLRRN